MPSTNRSVDYVLRALQSVFAIIVIGTDAYAIHKYRSHNVLVDSQFGNFDAYQGVPDSWSFLMFCAVWTFLSVIFLLVAGIRLADNALLGYIAIGAEAVAVLSWFAGFIAVAANIGSNACPAGENCATVAAAAAFGAFEWLLFGVTTYSTVRMVSSGSRQPRTTASGTLTGNSGMQMQSV